MRSLDLALLLGYAAAGPTDATPAPWFTSLVGVVVGALFTGLFGLIRDWRTSKTQADANLEEYARKKQDDFYAYQKEIYVQFLREAQGAERTFRRISTRKQHWGEPTEGFKTVLSDYYSIVNGPLATTLAELQISGAKVVAEEATLLWYTLYRSGSIASNGTVESTRVARDQVTQRVKNFRAILRKEMGLTDPLQESERTANWPWLVQDGLSIPGGRGDEG